MIYNSTHYDEYLWYLILHGKQKEKKTETPEYKVLPHFNGSEQQLSW